MEFASLPVRNKVDQRLTYCYKCVIISHGNYLRRSACDTNPHLTVFGIEPGRHDITSAVYEYLQRRYICNDLKRFERIKFYLPFIPAVSFTVCKMKTQNSGFRRPCDLSTRYGYSYFRREIRCIKFERKSFPRFTVNFFTRLL